MNQLDASAKQLDDALSRLEIALDSVFVKTGDPQIMRAEVNALLEDRARLADELDQSVARESQLQALADEASEALGTAIEEVRMAVQREDALRRKEA